MKKFTMKVNTFKYDDWFSKISQFGNFLTKNFFLKDKKLIIRN